MVSKCLLIEKELIKKNIQDRDMHIKRAAVREQTDDTDKEETDASPHMACCED